ncbi:hypothetical protein BD410DRAFT_804380 [Rickenella mellea]|uniref:DUF6533 domain-containing protein n=1 Tax=Rickenella mellea TaxID=50990 RepID=A0A4Y7Q0L6_9AGAM|nr:hypothetical protein BD410DRAFT_804380 [Rickenella mellea]
MSDAPTLSEISDVFNIFVNSRYATCVAIALIAYDYVLTMDLEINHIWSQPFSGATILYLMNRYGYPLVLALEMVQTCNGIGRATDATTTGIVAVAGRTIFTLRTWAIYLKSWKVLALVGLFAIAKLSMAIISSVTSYEYLFQIACTADVLDVYDNFHEEAGNDKLCNFLALARWLRLLHFIYSPSTSMTDSSKFPTFFQYDYSLEILNAIANIMINHLLLNLRHVSATHSGGGLSQKSLPEVAFASNAIIGNIGAPLTDDPEEFAWAAERATETEHSGPDMVEAESFHGLSSLHEV